MERRYLRATFEEVAELYDRARPGYPPAVFDDLATLTDLPEAGRILEIGCGTGQATLSLAGSGYEITCVELGKQLASVARRNLETFPAVAVVNADFETWEPDGESFDAVVAFTSFHWVDPAVRYEKSARLLRDGGALAVVATQHVRREGGEQFWTDVQEDYDAILPSEDNRPPPHPDNVGDLSSEIAASGRFEETVVRRHIWDVTYKADAYIDVLATYSANRALDHATSTLLFERIRSRIEAQPAGNVTKTYLATLNVARRR